MKCTVTFGLGNSPAEERAVAASRGKEVRIMELARVRGRSGEEGRSGIAEVCGSEGVVVLEGPGEDILLWWWVVWCLRRDRGDKAESLGRCCSRVKWFCQNM